MKQFQHLYMVKMKIKKRKQNLIIIVQEFMTLFQKQLDLKCKNILADIDRLITDLELTPEISVCSVNIFNKDTNRLIICFSSIILQVVILRMNTRCVYQIHLNLVNQFHFLIKFIKLFQLNVIQLFAQHFILVIQLMYLSHVILYQNFVHKIMNGKQYTSYV